MKVPWLRPLRMAALSALRRPLILLYHRIARVGFDPWALCVSPQHFEQHLHVLRRHKVVLPLAELVERMRAGRLPRHAATITFDDGCADNLHCAKPLLERYDLPATFFLTTSNILRQREYWWDELGRIIVETPALPARLTLATGTRSEHWRVPCARADRALLYLMLWRRLRVLDHDERENCLEALADWARVERVPRASHRPLRGDEVVELSKGRMSIGAHTLTHPVLSALPAERQEQEIGDGKATLEALLVQPVEAFSYPYGALGPGTADVVRRAGFACACATG